MKISLNNDIHEVAENISVANFLIHLKIDASRGFALAVNNSVVPRDKWQEHKLIQNDKILLIKASQGG